MILDHTGICIIVPRTISIDYSRAFFLKKNGPPTDQVGLVTSEGVNNVRRVSDVEAKRKFRSRYSGNKICDTVQLRYIT